MSYQSIINDKKKEQRYNPYTKQIEYVSISQDVIDGIIADIQYNNNEINLLVAEVDAKADTTNIISQINLSTEWIKIQANKITLIWNTEFTTLSNTVDWKINTWWAASDINANVTTINWWKITTWSITASQIQAWTITTDRLNFTPVTPWTWSNAVNSSGKVTSIDGSSITVSNINADNIVTGTLTGRTVQTASSGSRVVLDWALNRLRFHKSNGDEVAYIEWVTINFNGANTDVVRVLSSSTASFAAQNWVIAWTWFLTTATSLMGHLNPIADATYDLWTSSSYEWRNLRLNGTIFIKWIPLAVSWSDLYWNWVKIN